MTNLRKFECADWRGAWAQQKLALENPICVCGRQLKKFIDSRACPGNFFMRCPACANEPDSCECLSLTL